MTFLHKNTFNFHIIQILSIRKILIFQPKFQVTATNCNMVNMRYLNEIYFKFF